MNIENKFIDEFYSYKDYEERMGNKLKFVYNVYNKEVIIYCEEYDCYDGYDENGSPYYWALSDRWDNVSLLDFAKLMEFYLMYRKSYEDYQIYCYFEVNSNE